ncbi:DUF192 domain-containing protein [archaeon]|jgi:uncharacterized protein|nr:DUF192 domain-containing protein [archaeon]MBT3450449.1 DUF192 domain-containing protein [archaeon]MBT6868994.1 DUF192 domain-containing protein [archaeon]MBT7193260.1 DUF192 domain-containing protein [archaeon]MBT7380115.1 DUF192 domain-containing protein [archaeon]
MKLKYLIFLTFILSLLLISGCGEEEVIFTNSTLEINGNTINIEIANESAQWMQGLSNREELCYNCGMLFVFENTKVYDFWMKDTYISLDIIYIDESGMIVNIVQAEPCIEETCEGELCEELVCEEFSSNFPVKYVLEVNKGYTEELGIAKWDKIIIS